MRRDLRRQLSGLYMVKVAGSGLLSPESFLVSLMRLLQCWFITQTRDPNGELMRGLAVVFVFFLVRNGDLTNVIIMLIANLAGVSLLMAALFVLPAWRRTWEHLFMVSKGRIGLGRH